MSSENLKNIYLYDTLQCNLLLTKRTSWFKVLKMNDELHIHMPLTFFDVVILLITSVFNMMNTDKGCKQTSPVVLNEEVSKRDARGFPM